MTNKTVNINKTSEIKHLNVNINPDEQHQGTLTELLVYENIEAEDLDSDLLHQLYHKLNNEEAKDFATIKADFIKRNIFSRDKVTNKVYAKLIAILFAMRDPSSIAGQLAIELSVYESKTKIRENNRSLRLAMPLPEAVEAIFEFMSQNLRSTTVVLEFKRYRIYEIPIVAIREAAINALVHKDYSAHEKVQINLYRTGELEIFNPGGLYGGITLDDINSNNYKPKHRNPKIVDFLSRYVSAEGKGEGILTMKNEMVDNGLAPPSIEEKFGGVMVTLNGPGKTFDPSNYKLSSQTFEIGKSKLNKLNERQKNIVKYLLENPEERQVTNKWVRDEYTVAHETAHKDISFLVKLNLLRKEGSGRSTFYIFNGEQD